MVSIDIFAVVRQIREATAFMSGSDDGFVGRAVRVERMCKRLRIILDSGVCVVWAMGQQRVDQIVALF
jgi:hypothetical protein